MRNDASMRDVATTAAPQSGEQTKDTWVRPYFNRYRKHLGQALALGVLTFVCAAMLMFCAGYLISRCAERPEGGIFVVLVPVAFVQIFGMGKPIVRYIERLVSHDWVFRMTSDLRLRLYTALERSAMTLRRSHQTGDFLGLIAEDIGHLQNLYLRTIFPTVIGWILLALVCVFYGVFDILFALAMLVVLGLVVFALPLVSLLRNRERIEREKTLKNELYADLADNVIGSGDWVYSGREDEYLEHAKRADAAMHDESSALSSYYRANDLVATVILGVGAVAVFVWAATYFGGAGLPRADWIAAFVLGFFPLVEVFMPLTAAATQVNVYRDSTKRLNDYPTIDDDDLGLDPETFDTVSAVRFAIDDLMSQSDETTPSAPTIPAFEQRAADSDSETPTDIPPSAPVSVSHVSFGYGDGRLVLDDVSLDVAAGEKVAILGRSGSGKSTLASLIRGDLTPAQGDVRIAGKDVGAYGNGICHWIGVVQQSAYLFNRTLRDNLRIGRIDATDEEIWTALEAVELSDMVSKLPKGLDTMVDEEGMRFSGGERHRIALARVLLAKVPVILLDEPTVGLDPITESALISTLFSIAADKTLLMITHHLQDIERFNRVVFIEDGKVILDGSPAYLNETSERFRSLRAFDLGLTV